MAKKSQYNYGREKENLAAKKLRQAGANVELSPGSKGAEDMVAIFSNKKWLVQAKASRTGEPKMPSAEELRRLKQKATKKHATAVVALISRNRVKFVSARTEKELKP